MFNKYDILLNNMQDLKNVICMNFYILGSVKGAAALKAPKRFAFTTASTRRLKFGLLIA